MKILLAVDGSDHAQRAEAVLPALSSGARHRVTVFCATPKVVRDPDSGEKTITEILKENGENMLAAVRGSLARFKRWTLRSAIAESYDAARSILAQAEKEGSDLIVLGARGLSPVRAFFLGGVSHHVVARAKTSVLVVKTGADRRDLRLLVAVDGSAAARAALSFLKKLGLPRRTRLKLLHVVADPLRDWVPEVGLPGLEAARWAVNYQDALAALSQRGRRILEDALEEMGKDFTHVDTEIREGRPAAEIIQAAKTAKIDLIVLGRRGLKPLDRFLLGSVSNKVVSHAGTSVLIVQ